MNSLVERKYYCGDCGKELTSDEKPCSDCGSVKRNIFVLAIENLKVRDSVKGIVKDKIGKITIKFYVRNKTSKHGKEAKEELRIDIAGDWKFHHVEEQDENGQWVTVHHQNEPLKKKQRKET